MFAILKKNATLISLHQNHGYCMYEDIKKENSLYTYRQKLEK